MSLPHQIAALFILAIPIACISWTVTHEEIFRELREFCVGKSERCRGWRRKFFYVFTCEYCFSHYVTIFFLVITRYKLLYDDWRGYLMSLFCLVWVANVYMSVHNRIRLNIKSERLETQIKETIVSQNDDHGKPQTR